MNIIKLEGGSAEPPEPPLATALTTVESLNGDTFETSHFVLCGEVNCYLSEVIFLLSVYTRVLSAYPLLEGLSSFGVSFIRGFTVMFNRVALCTGQAWTILITQYMHSRYTYLHNNTLSRRPRVAMTPWVTPHFN